MKRPRPYGANAAMEKWASARKLKWSERAHCLHWVSVGRCSAGLCMDSHLSREWMDHVSGWIDADGKRLLLCQPYSFSRADCQTLIDACLKFKLKATIHGRGWYGNGTVAIELRPEAT